MVVGLQSPEQSAYWLIQGRVLFLIIHLLGVACFAYIVAKRLTPLFRGERDFRFDRPFTRLGRVAKFWLAQWKHPRYKFPGIVHILIFAGFILLATRAFALILGIADTVAMPAMVGHVYDIIKDYATSIVFLCMVVAATRRLVFKPVRYRVSPRYGKAHTADAIFLLG